MRFSNYMVSALLLLVLAGCKSPSPQEQLLQSYLQSEHSDPALELVQATLEAPTLASDSFAIVNDIFEPARDSALASLERAFDHSTQAYFISKEGYETTTFDMLKPEFKATMDESAAQLDIIAARVEALQGDCSGTELEAAYAIRMRYQEQGSEVLLQRYNCKFTSNGSEQSEVVFMDKDHHSVKGHLAQE